jgi:flagellar basal body rod protein FlgC
MSSIAGIAASGLRAASLGMQAAAHNVANLATPDATRQGVALSAMPDGGVQARPVEAARDPAAPLEDVAAMLGYRALAGASVFVLKVADQTLGSLLDVRA